MMIAVPDQDPAAIAEHNAYEARERRQTCLHLAASPTFESYGMKTEDVIARAKAFEAFISG